MSKFRYYANKFLGSKQEPTEPKEKVDELILEETDVNNQIVPSKRSGRSVGGRLKRWFLPRSGTEDTVTVGKNTLLIWGVILVAVCVGLTFFAADRLYFGGFFVEPSNKVTFSSDNTDAYNLSKLQSVIDEVQNSFYPGADKNVLAEGAIAGIVEALGDPYTIYYKPGTMSAYQQFISGTYEGIGAKLKTCGRGLEVTEVYEDSPAAKAAVAVGDIITEINGEKAAGMEQAALAELFGTGDTKLTLSLLSADGKTRTAELTVDKVQVQTVFTQPEGEGIYRVTITRFDSDTGREFFDKVTAIIKDGCRALVIDLRNNGGGYESQAVKVADMLLPEGTIATSKDKNGKTIKEIKSEASALDVPLAILVNGGTASASELLAGAVKDFNKGRIVGTQTYGKAVGQIQLSFEKDGSGLVITTACYYTPSGNCIQGKGITPDFHVELPEEYKDTKLADIPEGKDSQLQKALELINAELD